MTADGKGLHDFEPNPRFRVWPDGTTQPIEDQPYAWKSDDYRIVSAPTEEAAAELAE